MQYFFLYFSTIVSSIGSYIFQICLVGFLIKEGFSIPQISIVIGVSRLSGVLTQFLFGNIGDHFSPKKLLLVLEVLCAGLSFYSLYLWELRETHLYLFIIAVSIRASLLAIQTSSRSKLNKILTSSLDLKDNIRSAAWLNKVTHGSFFFAGIFSFYFINFKDFESVILLDLTTFALGGALILFLEEPTTSTGTIIFIKNPFEKFKLLWLYNKDIMKIDIPVAVALSGLNTLTAKIVNNRTDLVPYLYTIYGFFVWFSGFLKGKDFFINFQVYNWLLLALGFFVTIFFAGTIEVLFGVSMLYFSYWWLFHFVSGNIQKNTPQEQMASVTSARNIIMITVIASGEFLSGFVSQYISTSEDLAARGIFCILVFCIFLKKRQFFSGR